MALLGCGRSALEYCAGDPTGALALLDASTPCEPWEHAVFHTRLGLSALDAADDLLAKLTADGRIAGWTRGIYEHGAPGIGRALTLAGSALADLCLTTAGESAIASLSDRPAALWELHGDINQSNLLIDGAGAVVLIDWAQPVRGAAWIDVADLIPHLILAGHTPAAAEALVADIPTP